MENLGDWEQKNMINELIKGMELAKQLQLHLNASSSSSSSSHETIEFLVQNILNSYDKALFMLNCSGRFIGTENIGMSESPVSLSGSPHSDDSDRDFKVQEHKDASRKRKTLPQWTKQVKVCPATGLEGPLDDGYNWRKYGQKDILGATYPRAYYKCTHRNAQSCLATKQIQRRDEDPTILDITYRGTHTCSQLGSHLTPPFPSSSPSIPDKQKPIQTITDHRQPHNQTLQQETLLNFQTDLKLELDTQHQSFPPSFYFHNSTSNMNTQNYDFSSSMVDMAANSYTPFASPATSRSNYFSVSPELTEIISAPTNSPIVDSQFPSGEVEFVPNFTFDNPGFLP